VTVEIPDSSKLPKSTTNLNSKKPCRPCRPRWKLEEKKISSAEDFKKEIKFFDTFNKDIQKISADLSKITFENLKPHEIVDIVFENSSIYNIPLLLNAVLINYPSFILSSYDEIRRKIVEDKQYLLTNNSVIEMLKEHDLDQHIEKVASCYDLAYLMNHPHIYQLAPEPVSTSEYTLNFLWVNLDPQDRIQNLAQNIFKDGLAISENAECIKHPETLRRLEKTEKSLEKEVLESWNKIKNSFTYRISKWADVHPNAQINIWFDSALVTQKALEKTIEMLKNISESRKVNLRLRDIRQIPEIDREIEYSLHPATQLYYRVDMLKALIADHLIISSEELAKYCVIADIDIEPMPPQLLFDKRTLEYLSLNGYVFNRTGLGNFENSFFIFNKEKENLAEIHYETIIEKTALQLIESRNYSNVRTLKFDYLLGAQFVYGRYPQFRKRMGEHDYANELQCPRKVVKCPESQFNWGGFFSKTAFQSETFRFKGNCNVPYTQHGRNYNEEGEEGIIKHLEMWQSEPLYLTV
jgi:hypothetical protein